ncbi:YbhB/YbcL family Raf kinase inhibitor-like protein [Aliiroseovarius subalbicans]|uniref:YbhB/YbcL family Raf kinase inhibitor-like protein n=1 Tax=Aliiroseovarius subalbicans TaxID=2925840 RepID=UPI001F5A94DC|nr:YbhB/YbcL family Raf kinase inhibitor-like protein [Aliiroseovarius subalbicans]MCI2400181.1 hypothetical protein [Aliiroseovarius subalbicans]
MRIPALATAALLIASAPALADFSISFTWGDIPSCTTGRPGKVNNPRFVVEDLPEGTTRIVFRMKDLDVPGYNHGGGKVAMDADGTIEPGAFRYKSPCPPNGTHTYEWTAKAQNGTKVLATTTATRPYPE